VNYYFTAVIFIIDPFFDKDNIIFVGMFRSMKRQWMSLEAVLDYLFGNFGFVWTFYCHRPIF